MIAGAMGVCGATIFTLYLAASPLPYTASSPLNG